MALSAWLSREATVVFLTALRPARTLEGLWSIPGAPAMQGVLYNRLRKRRLAAAAVVFCDVERMGAEQEDRIAALARGWRDSGAAPLMLNTPPRALRRYALMKALKREGINRADVVRLDEPGAIDRIRFPCFIRYENGHIDRGGEPVLLATPDALAARLADMRAQGETLYGKIAAEYEDVRDTAGRHAKYSYFRVGDALVAGHRFVHDHWFVKAPSQALLERAPDLVDAERAFVEEAPFRDVIGHVFDIAGIEYGRVDFGVRADGGLHVFEINTNPRHPLMPEAHPARREIVADVKSRLARAFSALVEGRARVRVAAPARAL